MQRRQALQTLIGAGASLFAAHRLQAQTTLPTGAEHLSSGNALAKKWPAGVAAGLFIGVTRYRNLPHLEGAEQDATLLARSFAELGVNARVLRSPDKVTLAKGLLKFQQIASGAQLVLIYVAGHGIARCGKQYLLTSEADPAATPGQDGMISEDALIYPSSKRVAQRVLLFDACREAPRNDGAGTREADHSCRFEHSMLHQGAGRHVFYAAQPGAVAYDGQDQNSPFAQALMRQLQVPGLPLDILSRRVRLDVIRQTQGLQIPWSKSSLISPVVFNPA